MKRTPSFVRIVQVDYLAQLGVVTPAVGWAVVLLLLILPSHDASIFREIALVATVVGLALVAWRYRFITATYEDGSRVEGTVNNVGFFRDRGRVYYVYTVNGQKLMGSNAISRNKRTRELAAGQPVTITYHPLQPKRAFIDELYL